MTKRVTVYLEPELYQVVYIQAIETGRSVSQYVSESVLEAVAEDVEDLLAFCERIHEPTITYEALLEELRTNGNQQERSLS